MEQLNTSLLYEFRRLGVRFLSVYKDRYMFIEEIM